MYFLIVKDGSLFRFSLSVCVLSFMLSYCTVMRSYLVSVADQIIQSAHKVNQLTKVDYRSGLPHRLESKSLFFKPVMPRPNRPGDEKTRQKVDVISMARVFDRLSQVHK